MKFKELIETELNNEQLYSVWANMKKRINHPTKTHKDYKGLSYSKEWEEFEGFYKWAKSGYKKGLELDRIDVTKGYTPSNCRWVSKSVQQRNKDKMATNTSGYRGVTNNNGKWQAKSKIKGKDVNIFTFNTKEEASNAFEDWTKEQIKSEL